MIFIAKNMFTYYKSIGDNIFDSLNQSTIITVKMKNIPCTFLKQILKIIYLNFFGVNCVIGIKNSRF